MLSMNPQTPDAVVMGYPAEDVVEVEPTRQKRGYTKISKSDEEAMKELLDQGKCDVVASEENMQLNRDDVKRALKIMKVTHKRIKYAADETTTTRVINLRRGYASSLSATSPGQLLFLDESGFNLHTHKNYGYAYVGMDACATRPGNRGQNVSLVAIIGITGVVAFRLIDGALNAAKTLEFLQDNKAAIKDYTQDPMLVMDNVRLHHSDVVKQWLRNESIRVQFLPPYTPQLNPIENFFSVLKSRVHYHRPHINDRTQLKQFLKDVLPNYVEGYRVFFNNLYKNLRQNLNRAFQGNALVG